MTISSLLVPSPPSFQSPSAGARVWAVRPPKRSVSSPATAPNNSLPCGLPSLSLSGRRRWMRCMSLSRWCGRPSALLLDDFLVLDGQGRERRNRLPYGRQHFAPFAGDLLGPAGEEVAPDGGPAS